MLASDLLKIYAYKYALLIVDAHTEGKHAQARFYGFMVKVLSSKHYAPY